MKKEVSEIDKLFDEKNLDNVVLYDEKNNPVEFEQIAIIAIDEENYVILNPVEKLEGMEEGEALVFHVVESDDVDEEENLVLVEDDAMIDKVFDGYYELLKKEGIEIDQK